MSGATAAERAGTSGTESYAAVVGRYDRHLHRTVRRILRNDAEAEDALQDAYLRGLMHLDQFGGRSSLFTWLERIAVNVALTRLRGWRRFEALSIAFPDGATGAMPASPTRSPEQLACDSELGRALHDALDKLPERYRTALTMKEIDEMSLAEVAARLGITIQCLKTRLHRAKVLLRKRLWIQPQAFKRHKSSIRHGMF